MKINKNFTVYPLNLGNEVYNRKNFIFWLRKEIDKNEVKAAYVEKKILGGGQYSLPSQIIPIASTVSNTNTLAIKLKNRDGSFIFLNEDGFFQHA